MTNPNRERAIERVEKAMVDRGGAAPITCYTTAVDGWQRVAELEAEVAELKKHAPMARVGELEQLLRRIVEIYDGPGDSEDFCEDVSAMITNIRAALSKEG